MKIMKNMKEYVSKIETKENDLNEINIQHEIINEITIQN